MRRISTLLICLAVFPGEILADEDPFSAGVRPTKPLSPAEERKALHVPPGFEVQLFAAEPEIKKPLNMAFDGHGRLWVTVTQEYPYPAPPDREGRDQIKILEDTNGDGRADRVTTFADGLNIPMGVYPYKDGCIAFGIPNIWRFRDTDGDGKADKQEKLYGPMGWQRDTHGMNNAFRRGFDGWLYACHGFNNNTKVSGNDGHVVEMNSGNTYRMRLDGSRVEHFTHGQVNPFGMAIDPLGNLFTADCHSKPLTQLLRGAYYPSFGKPHDGLGFVPPMMDHTHGSTAISGVVHYTGGGFPREYRGNLFSGNVMTSRVNRNTLKFNGSTIHAVEQPDFLKSDDPWFRPVDLQQGPDGALYVADFYNRIIGHYEVPLDHPGRDRISGRIWRIVHTASAAEAKPFRDLTKASMSELIAALGDENQTVRMLATDQLSDRVGRDCVEPLRDAIREASAPTTTIHAMWVLHRLGALDPNTITQAAELGARDDAVHAMKVLAETAEWTPNLVATATEGLKRADGFVARAAADAFGRHPEHNKIDDLLDRLHKTDAADTHLQYVLRRAIRDQLAHADRLSLVRPQDLKPQDRELFRVVAGSIPTPHAATYLFRLLQSGAELTASDNTLKAITHIARHLPPEDEMLANLVRQLRARQSNDGLAQFAYYEAVTLGLSQRRLDPPASVDAWGAEVGAALLESVKDSDLVWSNTPVAGGVSNDNPWAIQTRRSADGDERSQFLCSLPHGEQLTGRLRSREFPVPPTLHFYAAGHNGPTNAPATAKNSIRLRDAQTHAILMASPTPRNDTAQPVVWDLKTHAGKSAYLEIIDGDTASGYAWIAVGRFEPQVVSVPATVGPREVARRLSAAAELSRNLKGDQRAASEKRLRQLLRMPLDAEAATAIARSLSGSGLPSALIPAINDANVSAALRQRICRQLADFHVSHKEAIALLVEVLRSAPSKLQTRIAESLAVANGRVLLELIERAQAPATLLQQPTVKERLLASGDRNGNRDAIQAQIVVLTKGLKSPTAATRELIAERVRSHSAAVRSAEQGLQVFRKHCMACHRVGELGSVIGPQLDGIGNRGLERVMEDLLDPNRNVDRAFQATSLALSNGQVKIGLLRKDEGGTLLLVDNRGKEFRVKKSDIMAERKSQLSLMPADVAQQLPEKEFHDLIAYLMNQRRKPEHK